jgi:hypothetical protein
MPAGQGMCRYSAGGQDVCLGNVSLTRNLYRLQGFVGIYRVFHTGILGSIRWLYICRFLCVV